MYNEELMNIGQIGLFHPVIFQHGITMAAAKIRNNLLFFVIYVIKFILNSFMIPIILIIHRISTTWIYNSLL